VSREIQGARYNPWEDIVDRANGRIWYWGDAKAHGTRRRDDWIGNQYLAGIWDAVGHERWVEIPPILHFSKRRPGTATFNGLCVLAELADAWFEDRGRRVRNYRAALDILPVDRVSLDWIQARTRGEDEGAPDPWKIYSGRGDYQRLKLHAKLVLKREEQLPKRDSVEWGVLEELCSLAPLQFEQLVVRAFTLSEVAHDITGTSPTRDGGFDFYGSFQLPPPLGYSIPLKGEVKRYHPAGHSVGAKDVSRLVARLQRGQHGVFVTTAHFSTQAQEEVYADKYPVELISGDRVVGMLQHLGAITGGRLSPRWIPES
jgi:hypothetical protein